MWTKAVDIYSVREIRTRSELFLGVGAMGRLGELLKILKEHGADPLLLLTGKRSFRRSGAEKEVMTALKESGMKWSTFVSSEPEIPELEKAAEFGAANGAKAVLAAGGGHVMDAGKILALLLAQKEKRGVKALLDPSFVPDGVLPLLAVNLSHGSGSENNPLALLSCPKEKWSRFLRSELFYPWKTICDPSFAVTVPKQATRCSAVNAVSHALESVAGEETNALSILLAHEIVRLVATYLPQVEKDPSDLEGRYFLQFASLLSGLASDNGGVRFAHALAHPLRFLRPGLPHELGVSVLLPGVLKRLYPACGKVLASVLAPIVPDLTGSAEEAQEASCGLENWISACGVKLSSDDAAFLRENLDELVETSYQDPCLAQLLSTSPLEPSRDAVRSLFDDALTSARGGEQAE
ncbi:MAG: iron-containing alcohol dehydrogenase [Lentisphaeria bacterium]|nr:iron-containing alcohol dehydrogenase [Lentisphaeria bacterium]